MVVLYDDLVFRKSEYSKFYVDKFKRRLHRVVLSKVINLRATDIILSKDDIYSHTDASMYFLANEQRNRIHGLKSASSNTHRHTTDRAFSSPWGMPGEIHQED